MEIEVGDYVSVRINKSSRFLGIGKVLKIVSNTIYVKMYLSLPISFSYEEINGYKHSKYPIDLIEVGDLMKTKGEETIIHIYDNDTLEAVKEDIEERHFTIETIVTHEQFANVEYKVEE